MFLCNYTVYILELGEASLMQKGHSLVMGQKIIIFSKTIVKGHVLVHISEKWSQTCENRLENYLSHEVVCLDTDPRRKM